MATSKMERHLLYSVRILDVAKSAWRMAPEYWIILFLQRKERNGLQNKFYTVIPGILR